ncbi:MAG: SDR family NAD(P)-dependent oxidoreductase [Spirochaetales bacterium]|nr:SDR family NAD(P)-dependent oxidoreductase [Spirochaetales bacterium]
MNKISIAAACLRGLSFDGEKGKIVTWFPETYTASGDVLKLASLPEEEQQIIELLRKEWSGQSLVIPEDGGTFVVADSWDEGQALFNGKVPEIQSREGRTVPAVADKVALVTGGAQGFGEGMVRELIASGAYVFIADMNIKGAAALAENLNREQGSTRAFALEVNVTNEESVEAMLDAAAQTAGGVDIFISNAGVLKAGSVKEMALKDFQFVTDVDYTGFFICTKFASRLMAVQNAPSGEYFTDIIGISSKSGLEGSNKNGAYAGAKFGSLGLTQSFALELVTDNIKVNSICPGNFLDGPLWSDPDRGLFVQYLNTGKVPGAKTLADVRKFYEDKVPMKRGCETKDVVKAIYYIVDQKYETGQAVPVTGGQIMLN